MGIRRGVAAVVTLPGQKKLILAESKAKRKAEREVFNAATIEQGIIIANPE